MLAGLPVARTPPRRRLEKSIAARIEDALECLVDTIVESPFWSSEAWSGFTQRNSEDESRKTQ